MITFLRKCICIFFFISSLAYAEDLSQRFLGQKVLSSSEKQDANYALALGRLKKIDGEWQAESERFIVADIESLTYEMNRPFNFDSTWTVAQEYFTAQKAKLIYQCSGLACGSSNAWANERFAVKQLYGIDLSQRYQVWLSGGPERAELVVLYLVKRGNKRVYLHLEKLKVKSTNFVLAPSAEVIALEFYQTGKVALEGLELKEGKLVFDKTYLDKYAEAFNLKSHRKLSIKVYDAMPGSEEEKQNRAVEYAKQISVYLQSKGVRKHRIEVEGLAQSDDSTSPKLSFLVELRN